jgi:glycosyltransferase involved in cell wall biosynthesis
MPEGQGSRLRVALDATALLGVPTGVGVFTSSVLEALVERGELEVSAFAISWRKRHELASHVPDGVSTEQRAMPARPLTMLWSRSNLAHAERFLGPVDVVHGTNFTVPPTTRAGQVVTVHDLTFLRFPELCQRDTLRYPALIARALRRGAVVHTPSSFVAEELRDQFSVGPHQVVAVHSGIPALPDPDEAAAAEIIAPGRPYILSVGTAEPRKDLPGLVQAFAALAAEEPELLLVLAGPPGWGSEQLDEAVTASGVAHRIVQPGYVSGPALSALLRRARVLAYPSLYEGFGFPPLQAMAVGVPVVTTRAGALNEIVGGASLMVEPGDTEALADALRIAVSDEAQRSVLITAGATRVRDFSWARTAQGLTELYRRVARH